MMTIVTHVHLKQGAGDDGDAVMRTRLSAARKASGWIGGQLLRPADKPDRRVIVGTWRTRANWEAWHHDPKFTGTRQRLDGLCAAIRRTLTAVLGNTWAGMASASPVRIVSGNEPGVPG